MIVVNRNWLLKIGMPPNVVEALEETAGVMLSNLNSFAGGMGGSRYTSALAFEPEPRTLMLVGLSDRYGAASAMGSTIELCTAGETSRLPCESERTTLLATLEAIDHPTARAVAAAVHEASLATPATEPVPGSA